MANGITGVTRRKIADAIILAGVSVSGRLNDVDFLQRLYDMKSMPSTDYRAEYDTFEKDVYKHQVRNDDWGAGWMFSDTRLNLMDCPDEEFLRFLAEMNHPLVRPDRADAERLASTINTSLAADGWEIAEVTQISGHPVYGARRLVGPLPVLENAKELASSLDAAYLQQQITRMEKAISDDPELAIGTAKEFVETISRSILVERGKPVPGADDFAGLVRSAIKQLKLVPDEIAEQAEAQDSLKRLLNNLGSIGQALRELRNPFGTGHGKELRHKGLGAHHARLAVNVATALGVFMYEAHSSEEGSAAGAVIVVEEDVPPF